MEPMRGNRYRIASKKYKRVKEGKQVLWEKDGKRYRFEPRFQRRSGIERFWYDGYMKEDRR